MKKCLSGFTLLEVLLAVSLVGLVGLSLMAVTGTSQRYLLQSMSITASQSEAAYALEHMRRHLQLANRIVPYDDAGNPLTGTPLTFNRIAFRYDHRSIAGGAATPGDVSDDPTPNNVNDDEWDYYGLDTQNNILYYRRDFIPGPFAGPGDPANPGFTGAEVIARGVSPPGAGLFTLGGTSQLTIDLVSQQAAGTENRQTRSTTVIRPRGIPTS